MIPARILFKDRNHAAALLAEKLASLGIQDPVLLGIPRGGVPIARICAERLSAPFTVFVSRKIGSPGNPELGIGAICEDGTYLVDSDMVATTQALPSEVEAALKAEASRCRQYVAKFRLGQALMNLEGKTAVLCDDGLATGITMLAAAESMKRLQAKAIVATAPVASVEAVQALRGVGAIVAVCEVPAEFHAVGQFYEQFDQLTDQQVESYLVRPVLYNE